jgi:hypothetical protein
VYLVDLICSNRVILGSPQGRVGAFNKATNDLGPKLIEKLAACESDFKTCLPYGLQVLTTCSESIELLTGFINNVRPKIMQGDKDPLFISLYGSPIRVGRYVSAFFKRISGLNISTTTIRSIVATESASLLSKGEISIDERDSVQKINGHSGITAQKYYIKRSRIKDAENALNVHRKLLGHSDTYPAIHNDTNDTPCSTTSWMIDSLIVDTPVIDFPIFEDSTAMPDNSDSISVECETLPMILDFDADTSITQINSSVSLSSNIDNVRRVPWTEQEIRIVGTWCKLYREQHPGNNKVVANCLHYIRSDKNVMKYFHPHHVADSARLRWGWQKFQEQEAEK